MAEPPVGYARVEGTTRLPAPGAARVGPADPNERLSVSLRLRRRSGAPPLPDLSQSDAPVSGRLSREEFAAVYGADTADIARVTEFASAHGLTVEETSIPRRTVVLAGTVVQMEHAFRVDLGRYEAGETSYRGREGDVYLPVELAPLVEGVFGLDNRRQARSAVSQAAESAQAVSVLTPPQVAQLYNFPAGSAAGQCIGLLEFAGGYASSDVTAWFQSQNLTAPALTDFSVGDAGNSPNGNWDDDGEVLLDIDVAGSVAQGARIVVYFAPWTEQGWVEAVSNAVHDTANKPSVISISWGYAEDQTAGTVSWTPSAMAAVSATFAEAAVLGVTVLAASGDWGSDCDIGDHLAHVWYPPSDPGVIACGGTTIQNVAGESFDEVLWNDTNGASGGGISVNFPVPSWQASVNVPPSVNDNTTRGRGVPDVAGNAAPSSGYNLIYQGNPKGPVAGTSAVAPLYAGLIARINAALGSPVGYLNPTLYQKAGAGSVFRDITASGTNAFNSAPGYPAGGGWDAATGLGSINGTNLLTALQGFVNYVLPGTAVVNSSLACFGVGEAATRLYYLDTANRVNELSWTGSQFVNSMLPGTAAPGSSLACLGIEGSSSRVYYLDTDNRVNELAWNGTQFVNTPLPGAAATRSSLACFAVGGYAPRVYYLGTNNQVNELAWTGSQWVNNPLPGSAAAGSSLACFGVGGYATRVYYLGTNNQVNELAWNGTQFVNTPLPGTAISGSLLACFGAGGVSTRLYYFDPDNRVNELAWTGSQFANNVLPGSPAPGSSLACFGAGGVNTRLYYLGTGNWVNELAWTGSQFVNSVLPGSTADNSPLTCFGVGGSATRLYFLDTDNRVNELAWRS